MMALVLAPDKFRGTATAAEVVRALSVGVREGGYTGPIVSLPIADGGEGTVDAFVAAGYDEVRVDVTSAAGRRIRARFASQGRMAVVEAAQACGWRDVQPSTESAVAADTSGVGEMILAALDRGCRTIVVGVGGTASTDGGAGMLRALGARFDLEPGVGAALDRVGAIDLSTLDARLADTEIVVATDVDNPLLGETGAAAVFGPQKGAGEVEIAILERRLARLARVLKAEASTRWAGAGAGGGLGFGLMVGLGASRRAGADVVLTALDCDEALQGAAVVVTGEGSLDGSSLHGKAAVALARRAGSAGVPALAVAGVCRLSPEEWRAVPFDEVYDLTARASSVEAAMSNTSALLRRVGIDLARKRLV